MNTSDPELYVLVAFAAGLGAMTALAFHPDLVARIFRLRPIPLRRRLVIQARHVLSR